MQNAGTDFKFLFNKLKEIKDKVEILPENIIYEKLEILKLKKRDTAVDRIMNRKIQ